MTGPLITREHRRFIEFADTVRTAGYIGVCYGPPGVGKTVSARSYAAADDWDQWIQHRSGKDHCLPEAIDQARTVLWTPYLTTTPRSLQDDVHHLCDQLSWAVHTRDAADIDLDIADSDLYPVRRPEYTELLIVDEADRLRTTGLEQLRDHYDRTGTAVIFIGMPGLERRLARYPQLYSRIGFAHEYRPLADQDLVAVLDAYWASLDKHLDPDRPDDLAAVAAVRRITGGNFRLIERLFGQIRRVLDINDVHTITTEVIDTARGALIVGA
ncbi:AAA family ATPase [Nakamurella endophytica]|uniref:ATP-binding protein n=1 Tax=Nakamurella endophytica TaxID=1748367 RepID=A0A917TAC7_9ACTN|nr:AAA family ATPase [Nakamurella endophytica]GGM16194.1 ATP-binding protein [Nakamurella endophytica]